MIQASGRARVEQNVVDLSVLINTGLKGIHAVTGVTERGPIGKSIVVGTWFEYKKHFGGYTDNSIFPIICKRALDAGVQLRVARAVHFTTVTDASTADGAVASAIVTPVDVGATGVTFSAANLGVWGNDVTVKIVDSADGVTGEFDIRIELTGDATQNVVVRNVPATLTAADVVKFNKASHLVSLSESQAGNVIKVVDLPLTGGTDSGAVIAVDIIGDSVAGNGIHAFDDETDFFRISVPEFALPEIDAALIQYVETRKDCRAILRTPLGISGNTAIEYRDGSGAYTHAGHNSWYASMVFGGLRVTHPVTGAEITIPAIADVMGNYAQKDQTNYEWFSAAGPKRGLIKNALGVDYNLGSPVRATEADRIDTFGINPVIKHPKYGLVYWGNSTLQKEKTHLSHDNIADLMVFLNRTVGPLAASELFDPNDVATWGAIYRKVRPLLELIKNQRGLYDYIYQGDQFIDSIDQLGPSSVNTPEAVDTGAYSFIVWAKPKPALKYIGIRYTLTNSGVSFEGVTGQPQ